ncbi:MAG TPA: TonB family protein [Bryobacteraceae bacterium]|jgi:TonB family protein|nr:TonB family protein [Bryobacteraceae bacterium]
MRPFGYTAGLAAAGIATLAALAASVAAQQIPVGQRVFRLVVLPGETADDLPLPPDVYRIADGVVGPVPLKKVAPVWSAEAKTAHLEGTAIVTGVIGADGVPRDMRVTRFVGFGLDEKALEAIAQWKFIPATYADRPIPVFTSIAVDFRLPGGPSRWHLAEAKFKLPDGGTRPSINSALLPVGAGISPDAIDEGQVVGASGRIATATLDFDIDERGVPVHIEVHDASAEIWGNEAIRVLRLWRFNPAMQEGRAIPVPATFTFEWGPRELPASREASLAYVGRSSAEVLRELHPPVISAPPPEYPLEAQLAGAVGTVVLSLIVDEGGSPKDLRVTEPVGHGLDEAAIAAVSKWKFRPMLINGRAEPVPATIRVDFYPSPPATRPRRK